jgi:amino acid transporter
LKTARETIEYVAISAGMALASGSFMVLSGLFTVTSGIYAVISVPLAGIVCAAVSVSISELASMYPSAPGIGTYLRFAFGRRISLAGVESFVFSQILNEVVPSAHPYLSVVAMFVVVVAINLVGFEQPRLFQLAATCLLVIAVIALSTYALMGPQLGLADQGLPRNISESQPLGQLLGATGMAVFLYMGFEWGLVPLLIMKRV